LGGLGVGVLDRPQTGGKANEGIGSRGRSAGQPSGRASNVVPAPPRSKTLTPLPLPPAESDLEEDLEEEKTRASCRPPCFHQNAAGTTHRLINFVASPVLDYTNLAT